MAASLDDARAGRRLNEDADLRSFVFSLLQEWPRDREFDARQILADHPELAQVPSAVAELAFEEYERRQRAGERVSIDELAERFPGFEEQLRGELGVLDWVEHDTQVSRALNENYFPDVGETFLGYELLELLGQGNCSRVYVARETELGGRPVVVKLCVDGDREAQALGQLEHESIVPVHSVHRHDQSSLVALCMPYLTRATLHDVLVRTFAEGRAPVSAMELLNSVAAVNGQHVAPGSMRHTSRWWSRQTYVDAIVDAGIQLTDALAFVHTRGACHGDLKPSNVLVTGGGRSLLLDFNLSSLATRAGALGGTLPYMAPEQLQLLLDAQAGSHPIRWNPQADLFGLAATLYHLLTGRLPFGPPPGHDQLRKRAAEMLGRQQRGVEPPAVHNPQVDAKLSRLIAACLSAGAAARPQTAEELAAGLRRHFGRRRRATRWVRRHRWRSLAMGGVMAVAGIATARMEFGSVLRPADGGNPTSSAAATVAPAGSAAGDRQFGLNVLRYAHRAEYSKGVDAIRRGDYAAGIAHLDRFLEHEPEHLDARFARGQARLMLGEDLLQQAEEQLFEDKREEARGLGKNGTEWLQQARRDFESVAKESDAATAKCCAGYCRARKRAPHDDDALTMQWLLEGVRPGYAADAAWNNIGYLQLERRQFERARASLETAIGYNKMLGPAHYNLGLAWFMEATSPRNGLSDISSSRECFEKALSCFEQAIAIGFSDHELHLKRVYILVQLHGGIGRLRRAAADPPADKERERLLRAAEDALRAGLSAERLRHALGETISGEPRLARVATAPVGPLSLRPLSRLVNPLADQRLPIPLR